MQIGFETLPGVAGQIKAGKLRALAVASGTPVALLPGVPTVAASGVPEFKLVSWNGFVVPAKTPPAVIDKLNKAIVKALAVPDVRARIEKIGTQVAASSPDEFGAFIKTELTKWNKVIDAMGIRLQ